ncbi:MAG TPA: MmcQ/YjbR family DNA-binding protein [Candidatus Polarisedimenticolia bacterium]|nr:MmcQ/YjbR family DNA-binding protein [Candidatus Polarisedimenticolia bacterium]
MPTRKKTSAKSAPRPRKSGEKRPAQAKRSDAGPAALAQVRRACLALPDTSEKIAWGAPTFRVKERLFVMFMDNHHGDGRLAIWCNAAPGAQEAFVARDGDRYFVPPYVGPSGWLGVRLDRGLPERDVAARIRAAHEATLVAAQARRTRDRGSRPPAPRAGERRTR